MSDAPVEIGPHADSWTDSVRPTEAAEARTMTATELRAELRKAFMAGFESSHEGFNGEYPFDYDEAQIDNALDGAFKEWSARG